jgi:hypothetical protein
VTLRPTERHAVGYATTNKPAASVVYHMASKSFTLFEVHLHDGLSFSASNSAPAIGRKSDTSDEADADAGAGETTIEVTDEETTEETAEEEMDADAEDADGGSGLKVLFGLLIVAGLAVAARKLMGESEDLEDLEELDDLAVEA